MINGYVPMGISLPDHAHLRKSHPDEYERRAFDTVAKHVQAMIDFPDAGAVVFGYGNNIRAMPERAGVTRAFDFPGLVPAFIRPLFCKGSGPFRFAALSGNPA